MLNTVVIVSDIGDINGGNAKVAINSALGLSKANLRIILFCGSAPVNINVAESNIEVVCLNQTDILNDSNRFRAIHRGIWNVYAKVEFNNLLRTLDPAETIVHFHSWSKTLSSSLFAVTKKYGFKIVITAHDYFGFCPNGGFFNYQKQKICHYKPLSFKCICCNCDHRKYVHKMWRVIRQCVQNKIIWKNKNITYITLSELNENVVRENLDEKFHVVRLTNPVELSENSFVDVGVNDNYLFIGRLSEEKGIDLFCEAITQLGVSGIVLGDGYKLNELKYKYPKIQFVGWVSGKEMEKYLYQAKCLIFPSLWYEGAPLTIIEMKSYGIPCIVSSASAAYEEIDDNVTGRVFSSGDLDDLKKKIIDSENKSLYFQNNILAVFNSKKYSLDRHVENLTSLYRSILCNEIYLKKRK